ncbi:nucleolar GTP-binding protein, putative [Eimeria tenella]|uniref:Nucleolar GTP-binding protein 1 n=1 Tax=Eimeria tenella TaxID=5802 RepID=U6KPW5_EIMTE|nr:nucleolar GTP-binding protein, putative [Eimeria tenella]CDJ40172.1 nucleolar GTP-binding protein, putative [Eimeria tenella]|eukprot:XP_013230925.1 nucleolar GTP-binding protein, putative [Eimeria tenella]
MELGGLKVKDLAPVLSAGALIDVCLSKTQRKTPTEIHKRSSINLIRKFYIRKIKTAAQFFTEKLKAITSLFPRLESLHPFYGDLLNILYDRDHYKLALGSVAAAANRIEKICKEYITISKYSDSLYKSKLVKKLGKVFEYLEEVRQHLQRLPSVETAQRTLLLAGFPNVGKSSFVNKLSNANVEVQPFAFTTKSLFVGHFDHLYARWQVIDTPGILDHPLEERNLIEMLAVAALTHLNCVVLFLVDVSEECGYSLQQQIQLFKNILVLFKKKPKLLILNKTDKRPLQQLQQEEQQLLKDLEKETDVCIAATSTLTGEGLDEAKNKACELLLQQRLLRRAAAAAAADPAAAAAAAAAAGDQPLAAAAAAASLAIKGPAAAMLHVSTVQQPRKPNIPESVLREIELKKQGVVLPRRRLERDIEEEEGGPGVYNYDIRKDYILEKEEWRYDIQPEFLNGKNIGDFLDPDIKEKLMKLEEEEQQLLQQEEQQQEQIQARQQLANLKAVRQKLQRLHRGISQKRMEAKLKKKRNGPRLLKKTKHQLEAARRALREEEINLDGVKRQKRKREASDSMEVEGSEREKLRAKIRRLVKSREKETKERKELKERKGLKEIKELKELRELKDLKEEEELEESAVARGQRRRLGGVRTAQAFKLKKQIDKKLKGRKGESDRFINVKKQKWMLSGKRTLGKTNKR